MVKKLLSITPLVFCLLFAVVPSCCYGARFFGWAFQLHHTLWFIATLTLLFGAAAIAMACLKVSLSKTQTVFATLLLPIVTINGFAFLFDLTLVQEMSWSERNIVILFVLISCVVSALLFLHYAKLRVLQIITGIFTGALAPMLVFWSLASLLLGGLGQNTVVASYDSPTGAYIAELVDSNQGALGGDTLVRIHKKKGAIDVFIGQFSKPYVTFRIGPWGEFKTTEMQWRDQSTLLIDGVPYHADQYF